MVILQTVPTLVISQDTIRLVMGILFITSIGHLASLLVGFIQVKHGTSLVSQILGKSMLLMILVSRALVLALLLILLTPSTG